MWLFFLCISTKTKTPLQQIKLNSSDHIASKYIKQELLTGSSLVMHGIYHSVLIVSSGPKIKLIIMYNWLITKKPREDYLIIAKFPNTTSWGLNVLFLEQAVSITTKTKPCMGKPFEIQYHTITIWNSAHSLWSNSNLILCSLRNINPEKK